MSRDETLCYVPFCRECRGVFGASVVDLDDAAQLQRALRDRRAWERGGFVVETRTVEWFRALAVGALRHQGGCSKDRPKKPTQPLLVDAVDPPAGITTG